MSKYRADCCGDCTSRDVALLKQVRLDRDKGTEAAGCSSRLLQWWRGAVPAKFQDDGICSGSCVMTWQRPWLGCCSRTTIVVDIGIPESDTVRTWANPWLEITIQQQQHAGAPIQSRGRNRRTARVGLGLSITVPRSSEHAVSRWRWQSFSVVRQTPTFDPHSLQLMPGQHLAVDRKLSASSQAALEAALSTCFSKCPASRSCSRLYITSQCFKYAGQPCAAQITDLRWLQVLQGRTLQRILPQMLKMLHGKPCLKNYHHAMKWLARNVASSAGPAERG